jgi:hypothetical protein
MTTREQLKAALDEVAEQDLDVLHRIIGALKPVASQTTAPIDRTLDNPLKGSVTFEKDIVSPIDASWSADA